MWGVDGGGRVGGHAGGWRGRNGLAFHVRGSGGACGGGWHSERANAAPTVKGLEWSVPGDVGREVV
eukprot:3108900-Prorocentrum_lima.AAC.1